MADDELDEVYVGQQLTIRHCVGSLESYRRSLDGVPARQRKKFKRWMEMQIMRLADGKPLSRDSFPEEGSLPALVGRPRKKFRAFKRLPIRGYCWKSDTHGRTYFISHYIHKKANGLKQRDIEKVGNN